MTSGFKVGLFFAFLKSASSSLIEWITEPSHVVPLAQWCFVVALRNDVSPFHSAMMRCLPLMSRRTHHVRSTHHCRRQHHLPVRANIIQKSHFCLVDKSGIFVGDPYGIRTHVTAVKGRCLNHLTNGPYKRRRFLAAPLFGSGTWIWTGDTPGMNRML